MLTAPSVPGFEVVLAKNLRSLDRRRSHDLQMHIGRCMHDLSTQCIWATAFIYIYIYEYIIMCVQTCNIKLKLFKE